MEKKFLWLCLHKLSYGIPDMNAISTIWKDLENWLHIYMHLITELVNIYYFVPLTTRQKYASAFCVNLTKVGTLRNST